MEIAALVFALGLGGAAPVAGTCDQAALASTPAQTIVTDCTKLLRTQISDMDAHVMALHVRAQADLKIGRRMRALQDLLAAALLAPPDSKRLMAISMVYAGLGLVQKGIEPASQAIAIDPNQYALLLWRASLLEQVDQPERAIPDMTAAIALKPQEANLYNLRASLYLRTGRVDDAFKDFSKVVELQPGVAAPLKIRAASYYITGQDALALHDLDAALHINPGDTEVISNYAVVKTELDALSAPMPQRGSTAPARAVARTHDCTMFYPPLCGRLSEAGDVLVSYDVDAKGTISNVSVVKPSGVARLDKAASLCVRWRWKDLPALKDDATVASPDHQAIIRFVPPTMAGPDDYFGRGVTHLALGDYAAAKLDFDQVIAAKPDNVDAVMNRGVAFYMSGQKAPAIDDFTRAAGLMKNADEAVAAQELARGMPDAAPQVHAHQSN